MTAAILDPAALGGLVEHLETESFFDRLHALLNTVLHIDNLVAIVFRPEGSPLILHQKSPQQPNFFRMMYAQGAYLLDPFYLASRDERRTGIHRLKHLAPDRFAESEFYRSYYAKVSMIDEIGLLWPFDDELTLHLSLGRRLGSERFDTREFAAFSHIAPLLGALLRRQARGAVDAWREGDTSGDVAETGEPFSNIAQDWLKDFHATARETEIAALILQGHSNISIGQALKISGETVKVHRKHLYAKLAISSQTELFLLFIDRIKKFSAARRRA
ncbi:MAG TPA: LuxR C-terminal-related transcriptional regulator [Hypericibacter adhaerens]|uniref:Helix-turn-helix transcriptional regulator n=1 Tax=Hypericibacter adhaerens TaxID=2602016 RepID=A0A5J6MY53_9PROT|nr:LuxR C-terminal-related transcriptional regulator [Hypericibacter adhaerens]QEX22064.1 helix-turn-helix transcriptional regulator [Hypericibacter adhaerens]HWA46278.1 LuxR C-terminal-related transcriptional regulator [Hypericibacter adhaerens]